MCTELGEVTRGAVLVALLYLVVRELDKGVVLLGQLGVEDAIVLFSDVVLTLLDHPLADQADLTEGEQGLVPARRGGHQGRRSGGGRRTVGALAGIESQLLPSVQLLDLLADVAGDLFGGELGGDVPERRRGGLGRRLEDLGVRGHDRCASSSLGAPSGGALERIPIVASF